MAEKDTCDVCGKDVGVASLYRRIGFTPGSRANKVCGSCFGDKLPREERLRFAKGTAKKAARKAGDEDERMGGSSALDELRGLG